MNKQYIFQTLTALCICLIAYILISQIRIFLHTEKEEVQKIAYSSLQKAIEADYQIRKSSLNDKFVSGKSHTSPSDSCTFRSTTKEVKISNDLDRSVEQRLKDFFQCILSDKNPIDVYQLDSLFQNDLHSEKISMKTAIYLTDSLHKSVSHTQTDTLSFTPLPENPYRISSIGITLRAYVKITPWVLLKRMPLLYWLGLVGWLLLSFFLGYRYLQNREKTPITAISEDNGEEKSHKEPEIQNKEPENYEQTENEYMIKLTPLLIFKKKEKILIYKNEPVHLTPQEIDIFITFLNAPGRTSSLEYFRKNNWPNEVITDTTIRKAISRLKKKLKIIPSIQIESNNKGEYTLFIREE